MGYEGLPGTELVRQGLIDLAKGSLTEAALLVAIGAPRLRRAGLEIPGEPLDRPELQLYEMLARSDSDSAHARYNSLIRRLVSFERTYECSAR